MPHTLKRRDHTLEHINLRTEKHGDEFVPARDLLLSTLVTKAELTRITGDKYKFDQMYDVGTKPFTPLWKEDEWGPHTFKRKFTDCGLDLQFGVGNTQISIDDEHPVKIKGIQFVETSGGQTKMTYTVQANFELNAALAELEAFVGKTVSAETLFGAVDEGKSTKKAKGDTQDELGLDHKADDEDDEEEEEEGTRGRKPRNGEQPGLN